MTLVGRLPGPRGQAEDARRVHPAEEAPPRPAELIAHQDGHHRCDGQESAAGGARAARRARSEDSTEARSEGSTESWRRAAENIMNHVKSVPKVLPTLKPGTVVTKRNAQVSLLVVRNPRQWSWGDLDGGAGKPGMISAIDLATETCTVYWYESGQVHDCSIGGRGELCMPRGTVPASLGGDDGLASVGMAKAAMVAVRAVFGGRGERGQRATTAAEHLDLQTILPFARETSHEEYAERTQTAIVFDWDDTLFPTTFLKRNGGLVVKHRLKDQRLRPQMTSHVRTALARAAGAADQLLRLADERGKVVIVTLAKSPWVTDSCRYFYPVIGKLIEKLNIQIVYAREGEQIEYDTVSKMANEQFNTFWAETKGKAISKALSEFYSQYEGQSWKNVISLGDSHIDRYGTMAATMQYAAAQGLVNEEDEVFSTGTSAAAMARQSSVGSRASALCVPHVRRHENEGRRMSWEGTVGCREIKVRTKTFKMLEEPTMEEFIMELRLLHRWLPLMVDLDDGLGVDLNSLDSEDEVGKIESALRGLEC